MNVVCEAGNLTRDPELRNGDGWQIATFAIAVQRRYKNQKTGQYEADFFECKAINSTAEFIGKHFKKGMRIEIVGHLQNEKWTNKDGQERRRDVIFVDSVSFGGSRGSGEQTASTPKAESTPQTQKADDFMDIPDGMESELPFN